ncbi:hypothetical protein ACG2F4_04425 [Halalkalibaculum sp. DA3122]|uniref:hypothetical protein n=1 Tax=unclassified Halalkalibaculum TaxID=2964617 RepID=UPI003754C931
MPDYPKARNIKQKYEKEWLAIDGVTAVGIGLVDGDTIGIIISVSADEERIRNQLPAEIEGIPVKVDVTGNFRAQ